MTMTFNKNNQPSRIDVTQVEQTSNVKNEVIGMLQNNEKYLVFRATKTRRCLLVTITRLREGG